MAARPSLTLVVAPPGFGKTSLLADWADIDPRPFAWVAIDRQDNDPTVLWTYIGTALGLATEGEEAADRLGALAREPDPAAALFAELKTPAAGVVLVLDDYHLIDADECHETVMRMIERAPPGVELAISSRTDPPLPIARLRATEQLVELRAPDLQFTPEETAMLVNTSLDLGLAADSVSTLHERTDGWPAGLYLAYLSMRATEDREQFVATFGGSNRHVFDYLTEQVLTALEPDTLQFMLTTSIVDTISGSLADALTEQSGSAQRLTALERANVFIAPLDDRREVYRYHPLLSDLLQLELARRQPRRLPVLHRRAANWYDRAGDADRAVRHAIKAGDADLAADIVGRNYLQAIQWGRMATLTGWLDALGPAAVSADRRLGVVKAWTMHFLGRHAEGDAALAAARRAPGRGAMPDGASSIEATAALVGAAFPGGDVGRMLECAQRAYALEGSRDSPWRVTVHGLLGFALVRAGRYAEAMAPLRTATQIAVASEFVDGRGRLPQPARPRRGRGRRCGACGTHRPRGDRHGRAPRAPPDPDRRLRPRHARDGARPARQGGGRRAMAGPGRARDSRPRPAAVRRGGAARDGAGPLDPRPPTGGCGAPPRGRRDHRTVGGSGRCCATLVRRSRRLAPRSPRAPTRSCRRGSSKCSRCSPKGFRSARRPTACSCRSTRSIRTSVRSTASST